MCGKYSAVSCSTTSACKVSRDLFIGSRVGWAASHRLNLAKAIGEMVVILAMSPDGATIMALKRGAFSSSAARQTLQVA
jgi:hypothetical protein